GRGGLRRGRVPGPTPVGRTPSVCVGRERTGAAVSPARRADLALQGQLPRSIGRRPSGDRGAVWLGSGDDHEPWRGVADRLGALPSGAAPRARGGGRLCVCNHRAPCGGGGRMSDPRRGSSVLSHLSVVVPTRDEAANLPRLIASLPAAVELV